MFRVPKERRLEVPRTERTSAEFAALTAVFFLRREQIRKIFETRRTCLWIEQAASPLRALHENLSYVQLDQSANEAFITCMHAS
jgi:hypothetical protein